MAKQGTLFIVSAPSGAGKRTVLEKVCEADDRIDLTVSATTRKPRSGEKDGRDYVFLDKAEFQCLIEQDAFVEWAEVHGNLYGTRQADLEARLASGHDVILELDIQGMRTLKALRQDVVTIFIEPPSLEELEKRIRHRGANDEADIALRMKNARAELTARDEFDYIVINDIIDEAGAKLLHIIRAHHTTSQQ